jgi:hypothetical protein
MFSLLPEDQIKFFLLRVTSPDKISFHILQQLFFLYKTKHYTFLL